MKHIHITLEDWEYKKLMKAKGAKTWHDLLIEVISDGEQKGKISP